MNEIKSKDLSVNNINISTDIDININKNVRISDRYKFIEGDLNNYDLIEKYGKLKDIPDSICLAKDL